MSIIRAPRPDSGFYTLNKEISEDARLSWAARGVLVFLLGKPDHWEVSVRHLMNQTENAIGKRTGRDGIRGILKELEQAGYLVMDQARSNAGEFNGTAYTVCEKPISPETEKPAPVEESPETDLPAPDLPAPPNPHLIKNELKQYPEKAANTDFAPQAVAGEVLPVVVPRCPIPADMPGPKDQTCKTFKTWANYAFAYRARHKAWPIWNAKVAGQFGQLIGRLGADDAPQVAAYFLKINDARIVQRYHAVGDLLAGAEAYHTQWATNRQMTAAAARQVEQTQTNLSGAQEVYELIMAEGQGSAFDADH